MKNQITASTWAEINLDNIKNNLDNIKNNLNEYTKVCGVVKANAYGHGSVEISKFLERQNIDYLAVARIEEAIELRQNEIKVPILCLGYINHEFFSLAIQNDIEITVYSVQMAYKLNHIASSLNKKALIHIKLDTGMSRLGFIPNKESVDCIIEINQLVNIDIIGIYTHFAIADEFDKSFTYSQVDKFNFIISELEKNNINIPIKHVSNSAAIIDCKDLNFNMVRCGIILYGHYPSDSVNKEKIMLKPAMTFKTKVAHIKDVQKGTGISYGLRFKTEEISTIITLPIGYADGFSRMQKKPKVLINDQLYDIVGRICMDQCMAKINQNSNIKIGDEVILFGDNEKLNVEQIANDLETINYEVLCMISRRVRRIYMEKNAILQQTDYLIK